MIEEDTLINAELDTPVEALGNMAACDCEMIESDF